MVAFWFQAQPYSRDNQLPDKFKDFATEHIGGSGPTKAFLAHCRRELFHEQVNVVLDEEFIEAWIHGIIIACHDGILRRFYPRIFIHSADYPEK
jgi:Plavaka transposase